MGSAPSGSGCKPHGKPTSWLVQAALGGSLEVTCSQATPHNGHRPFHHQLQSICVEYHSYQPMMTIKKNKEQTKEAFTNKLQ